MPREVAASGPPVGGGAASGEGRPPLPVLVTTNEVAEAFRTSRKVIYEMARKGQLPGAVRLGRRLLFRRDRLLEYLRERESSVSSLGGAE